MADLGGYGMRRQPTAAEVVGRLKDDGDFDALRRAIIRKVKDNEVLRNNIITEVKQSVVLSEDGSEKLKIKELSDAIFLDVGSKIMGQISDEIWSVIQSKETDIRGTVEGVFNRIMNPEQQQDVGPSSKKLKKNGKEEPVLPAKASTSFTAKLEDGDDDDPEEPPGFGFGNHQLTDVEEPPGFGFGNHKPANMEVKQDQPLNGENHSHVKPTEGKPADAGGLGDADDEDPDVPPGFG